jgi:hypothetical protein
MTDAPSHEFTRGLYGHITHTELASDDPDATQAWAAQVFGWSFQPPFPSPAGDYLLFAYSEQGGGGIRATGDGEARGRPQRCTSRTPTPRTPPRSLPAPSRLVHRRRSCRECGSPWSERPAAC